MSSRAHLAVMFVLSLVATFADPGLARAQSHEHAIYTSVLESNGTPLTTLSVTDFTVREDGVRREVLAAGPATDPLRIAVLVDTSQAMDPYVADIRSALSGFAAALQGPYEMALFGFGERPTLLIDYTRDVALIKAGVGRVFSQSGSGSYLLDAIVEVSKGLQKPESSRSAIVVITADGPDFSHHDHRMVLNELQAAEVTLHSFVLPRRRVQPLTDEAREREFALVKGADLTGGRREDVFSSMALKTRLEALAAELKNQYRVVYARPATLIGPTKVAVSVNRTDVIVRAPRVPRKNWPTPVRSGR